MDILITDMALDAIRGTIEPARAAGIEFGGSLLACETDRGALLIAYALPTGPRAEQGAAHITTDAAFQNRAIAAVRQRLPALRYAGDWHIHPMWLPSLSATDRATARAILDDEAKGEKRLVLVLGTSTPGGKPEVHAFMAQLDRQRRLEIEERGLVAVAAGGPEVLERLGAALPPLEELLHEEPPDPPSAATMRRIASDLEDLQTDLTGATFALRACGDLVGAMIRCAGAEAVVLFPAEYPLGAPRVFAGSLDVGPLVAVELRYGWSSLHRLADPVADALRMARWRARWPAVLARRLGRWLQPQAAVPPEAP